MTITLLQTSNTHKRVTFGLYAATIALAAIPFVTSPMFKEYEPELQTNIKLISWGLGLVVAAGAAMREESRSLKSARSLSDGAVNVNYNLQRMQNAAYHDLQQEQTDVIFEQRAAAFHARSGYMGYDRIPGNLQPFAVPQSAYQAAQQAITVDATTVGGVTPQQVQAAKQGGLAMPQAVLSPAQGSNAIPLHELDGVYQQILSKNTRNVLNTLMYGGTGDCKTATMHYIFKQRLVTDPDTVFLIYDRKHMSAGQPGAEVWQSCWMGAPTYPRATGITEAEAPFTSVYADINPDELNAWLRWIWKYLEKWRFSALEDPVSGEFIERGEEERRKDPLWCDATQRIRPIIVVIDDGTAVFRDMENKASAEAVALVGKIGSLGRSEDVHIYFTSHSNTEGDTRLPGTLLDSMAVLMGAQIASNSMRQSWGRVEMAEGGVERLKQDMDKKARGFATSFAAVPYLPAAPYHPDQGLMSTIDPALALQWLINSPAKGRLLRPWHQQLLLNTGHTKDPTTGAIVPGVFTPSASFTPIWIPTTGPVPAPAPVTVATTAPVEAEPDDTDLFNFLRGMFHGKSYTDAQLFGAITAFGWQSDLSGRVAQVRWLIDCDQATYDKL